jgi:hypothetical protein
MTLSKLYYDMLCAVSCSSSNSSSSSIRRRLVLQTYGHECSNATVKLLGVELSKHELFGGHPYAAQQAAGVQQVSQHPP